MKTLRYLSLHALESIGVTSSLDLESFTIAPYLIFGLQLSSCNIPVADFLSLAEVIFYEWPN